MEWGDEITAQDLTATNSDPHPPGNEHLFAGTMLWLTAFLLLVLIMPGVESSLQTRLRTLPYISWLIMENSVISYGVLGLLTLAVMASGPGQLLRRIFLLALPALLILTGWTAIAICYL